MDHDVKLTNRQVRAEDGARVETWDVEDAPVVREGDMLRMPPLTVSLPDYGPQLSPKPTTFDDMARIAAAAGMYTADLVAWYAEHPEHD